MLERQVLEPRRLPRWIDRALSIAEAPGDSLDQRRTKRLTAGVLWVAVPVSALSALQMVINYEAPAAGVAILSAFAANTITLGLMWRRPEAFHRIIHFPLAVIVALSAALVVMAGGLVESAVNSVWGVLGVMGATAIFGDRRSTFWLWAFVVSQVGAVVMAPRFEPAYVLNDLETATLFNLIAVAVFVIYMMTYYARQRALLLDQSDSLLRNILPDAIARRLKESTDTIADHFDAASVLFADVVGFTPMSADMEPAELVGLLDDVFSTIDEMVEGRGLEKIKTIGDAYMVAAGVPLPRADHAHVLCDLALELRDLFGGKNFSGRSIRFRIGINSGPVVAGVIGTQKFSYDLWGDTVNTASRMESSGDGHDIQITESTMRLVSNEYECQSRGLVDVKGKGPMEVWALVGRRST